MIIGLNYGQAKTLDELNDQMAKIMKEIKFLTTGNIDAENIRANSITADLITAGAITTTAIADGSISNSKLIDGTIQTGKLADNSITNAKIINDTIQGIKLQAGTLTDTQIANLAITGSKIANTTITGNKIVTGTITADKLNVISLSAISADCGTITAGTITGVVITGGTLRTSASGSRIEVSNNSFDLYDTTGRRLRINSVTATTTSGASIDFQTSGSTVAALYTSGSDFYLSTIGSNMDIRISPDGVGYLYFPFTKTYDLNGNLSGSLLSILNGKASTIHYHSWSDITSGKPTSLSGYGILDGVNTSDVVTTATANKILKLNGSAKLPADITGNAATATNVGWSGVTSTPTTLSGYGINDAYTKTTSDNKYGGNLVYNTSTKLLKLFAPDGTQLASVDISGS